MKNTRDWIALLDRILDKAEPAWLLLTLVITGAIYVTILVGLFSCG